MTDREKAIWQASRGDKPQMIALLTKLFDEIGSLTITAAAVEALEKRIEALESRRGPGRPKGS
jgi:hypothetical protein